ncbi:MAG: discoidin domain-containing protein [Planctomycetota bacterium]
MGVDRANGRLYRRGGHSSNYAANSERLEYVINFVKTGMHYVWILAWGASGSDDSCHAGLDGEETPLSDNLSGWNNDYEWNNGRYQRPERAQIEITTPGIHVLNIWVREDGLIVDKIVLTTNPDYTLTGSEPGPPESHRGARVVAFEPIPADGATDVPRDVVLRWTAGALADKHDVYFGTVFDDVNQAATTVDPGGVYQDRIDPSIYTPAERLAFSETYYWRVDEVNAPPDSKILEGNVWSFTTEPFSYAIENIIATASSVHEAAMDPQNTVNGSGLDANDLHSTEETTMWLSSTEPPGAWIEYEFDDVYKIYEMWVWNSNQAIESVVGFGLKDVTIEYSTNGTDYTTLGTTHEFARAPGMNGYAHDTTIDFGGAAARYVRFTANSNWGGLLSQYSLSEVRFFYIPVYAREPIPDSGATDVSIGTIDNPTDVTLGFRAGREAAAHDVYFSDSWKAVANGTADVTAVTEASHGPLALDLGQTYYWRVDEVNEVETPAMWQGDVWGFTTQEYFIVDDFESYNDLEPADPESDRIFLAWMDGYDVPTNGSLIGYDVPPFAEQSIIHSGMQAMPYFFDNSGTANYSEATLTLSSGRDWTIRGIKALSLWFRGNPAALVEAPVGTFTVNAAGTDIWGTSDEFRYVWKQLSGDGEIVAQVLSVQQTDDWAKAGVMIRNTLDADSANAIAFITDSGRVGWQYRAVAAGDTVSTRSDQGAVTAPHWVKLTRQGNIITAQHSSNGVTWEDMVETANPQEPSFKNILMSPNVYIGLALTSHVSGVNCEAKFSDVQTTGMVSGQFTPLAIGADMPDNGPAPIYVALANSGGTPAVVYHDDTNATQIGDWTQWPIDLKQFADQGVNLGNLNTIAIGFGDRNNPQPGGSGLVFFDDIQLYPSRCILSRRSADFAKLDYVEDCAVNYREFEVMAEEWLLEELTPGGPEGIWLEAELADTIGASWRIYDDPNSSGGKHIGSENGDGDDFDSPPGADWLATYNFTAPAGVYKVLLRGQEADSDSFWVRIPGATNLTPGEDPDNPGTGWVRFNGMDAQGGWNWDEVHSDDHDQQVANWTLPGGTHTLEIAKREDGTWLDAILITDNLDLLPVTLSSMPADLNEDKRVDFKDYAILADAWLDEQLWPAP